MLTTLILLLTTLCSADWKTEASLSIPCLDHQIWDVLLNVNQWNSWDPDLKSASLLNQPNYPSLQDASGILEMNFGSNFTFTITNTDENKYFAYKTSLTGADLIWYWKFENSNEVGVVLVEGVEATGWLSYVYKLFLEERCKTAFQHALVNIRGICAKTLEI